MRLGACAELSLKIGAHDSGNAKFDLWPAIHAKPPSSGKTVFNSNATIKPLKNRPFL